MITLDLKIENKLKKVKVREDVIFNAILVEHPEMIKKLIKATYMPYKISDAFFRIINPYVDFDKDGSSLYPGLIVRTGVAEFAVLYLENSYIDEEYMICLVKDFVRDNGDFNVKDVNINKIEVDKKVFLKATGKL